jgi:biotin synthase
MNAHAKACIDRLFSGQAPDHETLSRLIADLDDGTRSYLRDRALEKRRAYYGNTVYMRGLIEFTNICKRKCLYCGISADRSGIPRYRLTDEEILACCEQGFKLGYRTFVLQGGEDPFYTDEHLQRLVRRIKERYPEVALTLSIGERSKASYEGLREAGADRYLLRHETASESLYRQLHPDGTLAERKAALHDLKTLDFQVGAGFMVGLPGQTPDDLAADLLFLRELDPQMIGIGPFIPHSATPLKDAAGGTLEETLDMVALTRLLVPKALLPATTALGTLDPLGREKALAAGANVVMPNLSPTAHRENYELYENKICTGDEAAHCRQCIEGRINRAGFTVDLGRGDYDDWRKQHVHQA